MLISGFAVLKWSFGAVSQWNGTVRNRRVLIVKTHYQNGERNAVTVRKLRTIHGHHAQCTKRTECPRRLIRKFAKKRVSTRGNKIPGRPSKRPECSECCCCARSVVLCASSKTAMLKKCQWETTQRILAKDLHLRTYKVVKLTQELWPGQANIVARRPNVPASVLSLDTV